MINWEEWKEKDVPACDKEYEGRKRRTGLEEKGCDWECYEEFLDDFAYELQEAKSQGLGLFDWQEWFSLEYFFGQRLSYEDYLSLKEYYDNDEDVVNGNILDLEGAYPIIPAIRKGDTAFFTCSDDESEIKNAKVTILRLLTSEEADLFDIGPMYKVQMADGSVKDAFYDELRKFTMEHQDVEAHNENFKVVLTCLGDEVDDEDNLLIRADLYGKDDAGDWEDEMMASVCTGMTADLSVKDGKVLAENILFRFVKALEKQPKQNIENLFCMAI